MVDEIFNTNPKPKAFLFDMDHTLINNDCDVSWKSFLVEKGVAPADALARADFFFEQYKRGELDINEFIAFQLAEFDGRTIEEMAALADEHFKAWVEEKMYAQGKTLLKSVLETGKPVAMLTATNKTIAAPVAKAFGIEEVLACSVKFENGQYHAELADLYSYGDGKVTYAEQFCKRNGLDLSEVAYFGDSLSDLTILGSVGFPVAANPVPGLREVAGEKGWPIVDFS